MRGFTVTVAGPDFDMNVDYRREDLAGAFRIDSGTLDLAASPTEFDLVGNFEGEQFDATITLDPDNFEASLNAAFDGDTIMGSIMLDPDGFCSAYSLNGSDGTNESGCLEQEDDAAFYVGPLIEALEDWPSEFPGIDMRVRQTDGGWYVSPIGTIFDGIVGGLEGIEEDDFDDLFEDVAGGLGSGIADEVADGIIGGFDDDDFLTTEPDFDDDLDDDFVFSEPEPGLVTSFDYQDDVTTLEGDLTANTFDLFTFELDEGDEVLMTAIAIDPALDTIITVYDGNGTEIARNDDAQFADLPSSLDSQADLVAPADGTYTIEISDFGNSDGGRYELTVEPGLIDETFVESDVPDAEPEAIENLESQSLVEVPLGGAFGTVGFVGGDQGDAIFDIELTGGDELTITVESANPDDLDPTVSLFLDGVTIGFNDDADDSNAVPDQFDSQLLVTAPADGVYQIVVAGFAGSEGDFQLEIERN